MIGVINYSAQIVFCFPHNFITILDRDQLNISADYRDGFQICLTEVLLPQDFSHLIDDLSSCCLVLQNDSFPGINFELRGF
jgi:hypothetical protein